MLDRYNRKISYLRISVTDLCNLRCVYCMPPQGVKLLGHKDILTFEEICEVVKEAVDLNISKIRLTGGEPLVRRGIVSLVRMIKNIGVSELCMTTNGVFLSKFAEDLKKAGLDRVNVSLDSMDDLEYSKITRGGLLSDVLEGINIAKEFFPIKLNCVISDFNKNSEGVARFADKNNFPIRFIKRMDLKSGTFCKVYGGEGGVCSKCNRLRLTSNGFIKPCLFNDFSFSIKDYGPRNAILRAIEFKPKRGSSCTNGEFYSIGG